MSKEVARAIGCWKVYEQSPKLTFALKHHRTSTGELMRFDNRPWLIPVYEDESDRMVIQKSSKTCITEFALLTLFYQCKQGLSCMYILPDQPIRNRFITTRFDPMVARVKEYRDHMSVKRKDVDAKELKTIYGATAAFVGAHRPGTFYEFTSDFNFYDELDQCNPTALVYAQDRTLAAETDRWYKIGNPTIEGTGINEAYENSDKKQWMLKCPRCNESQVLDWFVNFVREEDKATYSLLDSSVDGNGGDAHAVCRRCNKPIDRLGLGEWVAENRDNPVSGYHVSRLFGAPGNDFATLRPVIREMFEAFTEAQNIKIKEQRFWNNLLGIPFASEGSKFTESLLASCVTEGYRMPDRIAEGTTFAGVDVGTRLHLHIAKIENGMRRKVFIGTCTDFNDLQLKCHQFKVSRGIIDALPETHKAKEWCQAHPGWYRCYYVKSEKAKTPIDVDHKEQVVNVNRTWALDAAFATYLQGAVHLPIDFRSLDDGEFVKQMRAATRVKNEDKNRYEWQEAGKPDHHQHADCYENLNLVTGGEIRIS
jgi:hypothetical protein